MGDPRMVCPLHGVALEKQLIQGDKSLGYLWICPADDECSYCVDEDEYGNPIFDGLYEELKEAKDASEVTA